MDPQQHGKSQSSSPCPQVADWPDLHAHGCQFPQTQVGGEGGFSWRL